MEPDWLLTPTPQLAMLRKRISTRMELTFQGREEAFFVCTGDGAQYVCKGDLRSDPVRANEWLFTSLCSYLGISTAACEIIEDDDGGSTYFGSSYVGSANSEFRVRDHLSCPSVDELGQSTGWMGKYLARLYAYDMFIHNDDRTIQNFLLSGQTLMAIDFASARLNTLGSTLFPVASSATVRVGKMLRKFHGFDLKAAMEMMDLVSALPASVVEGILSVMPSDWLSNEETQGVMELWQNGRLGPRIDALRSGLKDGSLL